MTDAEKNRIIEKIEDALSYLLSRKYDREIKIYFKKVGNVNGDGDKTGVVREEQILDRKT